MLAKLTYKNQITLPKNVVKDFPGVDYYDVSTRKGEIVLKPTRMEGDEDWLEKIRDKIKALGITPKDVEDAIRWARKKPH